MRASSGRGKCERSNTSETTTARRRGKASSETGREKSGEPRKKSGYSWRSSLLGTSWRKYFWLGLVMRFVKIRVNSCDSWLSRFQLLKHSPLRPRCFVCAVVEQRFPFHLLQADGGLIARIVGAAVDGLDQIDESVRLIFAADNPQQRFIGGFAPHHIH